MASTGVRIGHGARVRIGRGATPTWTVLSGVEDFSFPDTTPADEDVTSHDSPGAAEEFIPGLRTSPDWSVTKHYVPEDAEDDLLQELEASKELVLLEILPSGATEPHVWQGYVKTWLPTVPVKGAMKGELTLKIKFKVVD